MGVYTEKFQFFNVKYHAIIEIVECESGRVAKKLSSASGLCEYAGTRPFPNTITVISLQHHLEIALKSLGNRFRITLELL